MQVFDVDAPVPQGPPERDKQTFLIGAEFHQAALLAATSAKDPIGIPIATSHPMVVRYAFAAKLYLKSLLRKPKRLPALHSLYEKLDAPIREEIAAACRERTGGRDVVAAIRRRQPAWTVRGNQDERFLAMTDQLTVKSLGGGTCLHMIDGTKTLSRRVDRSGGRTARAPRQSR